MNRRVGRATQGSCCEIFNSQGLKVSDISGIVHPTFIIRPMHELEVEFSRHNCSAVI